MRTALPGYLGNDFAQAAPGHRFGLYYAGWNEDFTATKIEKTPAVESACALPGHSQHLLAALLVRQSALAEADAANILALPCRSSSPFATGLGNEHPLENGFSFLTPYGLPYLPGSGVKGVLRRAAEELESGEWGERHGWSADAIRTLFGPGEEDPTRDDAPQQGALRCWDVLPQPHRHSLTVEIMTPHLGKYYQGETTPNTSLTPNPIPFLAVPAGSGFAFHIECLPGRIADPELFGEWKTLVEAAFAHAAEWCGFGAKTAAGYGRMEQLTEQELAAQQAEAQKCAWVEEKLAELAAQNRCSADDALRGKALAEAWQAIGDDKLKAAALADIARRWQVQGWWDAPPGKAARQAKAIYAPAA